MRNRNKTRASPNFYPHPLYYWKPIGVAILLIALGYGGIQTDVALGLILWGSAVLVIVGIVAHRTTHYYYFVGDGRLVRTVGLLGTRTDFVDLFGQVSSHRPFIIGHILNLGNLYISTMNADQVFPKIGNYRVFEGYLRASQTQPSERPVVVVLNGRGQPVNPALPPPRLPPANQGATYYSYDLDVDDLFRN